MKKFSWSLLIGVALCLGVLASAWTFSVQAAEPLKAFTPAELSVADGKEGRPAYFAYEGKVYDVTKSSEWKNGDHYGSMAGQDYTGQMSGAPHGDEVLDGLTIVGTYDSLAAKTTETKSEPVAVSTDRQWYESRIKLLGISILGWTGILLGVLFVLNFATCFVLPWSQLPLPWKGSQPGADALDQVPTNQHWSAIHKYFAWGTVTVVLVHGIIGFFEMLCYSL